MLLTYIGTDLHRDATSQHRRLSARPCALEAENGSDTRCWRKDKRTRVCLQCVSRFRTLAAWRTCTASPLPSPSLCKCNLSAASRVSSDKTLCALDEFFLTLLYPTTQGPSCKPELARKVRGLETSHRSRASASFLSAKRESGVSLCLVGLPACRLYTRDPSTQVPEFLAANGERVAVAICSGHRDLQIKG